MPIVFMGKVDSDNLTEMSVKRNLYVVIILLCSILWYPVHSTKAFYMRGENQRQRGKVAAEKELSPLGLAE